MSNPKPLQFAAVLQIAVFLAVLVVPLARTNFRPGVERSVTENRNLNTFPKLQWTRTALDTFPSEFEAAFNDHFGFRNQFTYWHALIKTRIFGVSPVEKVTMGKDDWFYLTGSVDEYRGKRLLKKNRVPQWIEELKAKRAWLEARGIRYLLVVAPNKEEIYPEYLPASLRRSQETRNLDILMQGVDDDLKRNIVDLRDPLLKGRQYGLVFDRTDTHWSHLGIFLSCNEILSRLQTWYPQLQPMPIEQRPQTPVLSHGGDLVVMLGIQAIYQEKRLCDVPPPGPFATGTMRFAPPFPEDSLQEPPFIFENPSKELTVLITGDSFGKGLLDYLPEHVRRVVRLRPEVPYSAWFQERLPALVEAEKPDIYLDVFCSRSLQKPPKTLFSGK